MDNILDDSTVKAAKRYEGQYMIATPHLAPIAAHRTSGDSDSICILILPLLSDFPIWGDGVRAAKRLTLEEKVVEVATGNKGEEGEVVIAVDVRLAICG